MYSKAALFSEDLAGLAEYAKALAHPARLQILVVLARRGTCICGDIVNELPLAQASVSRHLRVLKDAGFINGEIDGPRSCYCINGRAITELRARMDGFLDALPQSSDGDECC